MLFRYREYLKRILFSILTDFTVAMSRTEPNLYQERFVEFAERLRENGTRLVVINSPLNPIARTLVPPELEASYRAFLAGSAVTLGYQWLDSGDVAEFGEGLFVDAYHVNEAGRRKLTVYLGGILERELARL